MRGRRPAAVAGRFYPGDAERLREQVQGFLGPASSSGPAPKAIVVPHAGYVYSGPVAGAGYARLAAGRGRIRRVVLLGPAHWAPVEGLATSGAEAFESPLGPVRLDEAGVARALELPQVHVDEDAHAPEHSLEVQLPFLQVALGEFGLVPLLVGRAEEGEVAGAIDHLWGGDETAIVVSTDLSHYRDYRAARRVDRRTSRAVEALEGKGVSSRHACGYAALRGLLATARRRGLRARTLDLRSSGDTAGPKDRVVGYGAWALSPS